MKTLDKLKVLKHAIGIRLDSKPKYQYKDILKSFTIEQLRIEIFHELKKTEQRLLASNNQDWIEDVKLVVLLKAYVEKNNQNYAAIKNAAIEKIMKNKR